MSEPDKGAPVPAPPTETEPATQDRPEPPRTIGGIPVASRPEPPRLRHDDRVLPSGLHVAIRMFTAGDFDRMLNEQRRPSKSGPITILQECVTELHQALVGHAVSSQLELACGMSSTPWSSVKSSPADSEMEK